MSELEISLYGPQNSSDLKKLYPVLMEEESLKNLNGKELLLTWYFSNPTSKIVKKTDVPAEKWRLCFIAVYGEENVPQVDLQNFINKNYGSKIKEAIIKWSSMRPDIRYRSKLMAEKMYDTLEKMIEVDDEEFLLKEDSIDGEDKSKKGKINWSAKKQYASTCKEVSELLPSLIKQIEDGFGIIVNKKQTGVSALDDFHKRNS